MKAIETSDARRLRALLLAGALLGGGGLPAWAAGPAMVGDEAAAEYLLLRDHLRAHAGDHDLDERTQRTLLEQESADAKTDVLTEIKDRVRRSQLRDRCCRRRPSALPDLLTSLSNSVRLNRIRSGHSPGTLTVEKSRSCVAPP